MTVLYGTLGFTPTKLLPSVSNHPDVTRLVVYHDRHARSKAAAAKARAFCQERGLRFRARELDAFDIITSARVMRKDLAKEDVTDVVFNVTGGTPVISCAATLACILDGVRAVYVDERDGREVPLPLLSMRYQELLNPAQRRVLAFVAAQGKRGCTQADVRDGLALSRGTVSHHVNALKERRLLEATPDPDDQRKETLTVLESAGLLLMGDDDWTSS